MNTGSRTIVGNFHNLSDAHMAMTELRSAGYQDIKLIENDAETYESEDRQVYDEREHEGGLKGFFTRLFGFDDGYPTRPLSTHTEQYFRGAYENKQHLVIISSVSEPMRCMKIIEQCRGIVEEESGRLFEQEVYSDRAYDSTVDNSRVMELREEQLNVGKERVQAGEVQIRKEIVTEMKTVEVPLTREEIVVERRNLDGIPRDGSLSAADMKTEEIRIPVSEEHVHIEKQVVPREEVRVSARKVTDTEVVSEEIRREEARIQSEGRVTMKTKDKGHDAYQAGL